MQGNFQDSMMGIMKKAKSTHLRTKVPRLRVRPRPVVVTMISIVGGLGRRGGNSNSWESPGYKHSPAGAKPSPMYQNRSSAVADRTKDKLKASNNSPADAKRMNHHGHKDRDQRERDHRSEVQKSAVRVFGDWSEHVSSSGKGYFYNCRTEVSQWERPKEWVEAKGTDGRSREKDSARSAPTKAVHNEQQKHSTGDNRMGASSRLVTDQQRPSTHTNNNHRQSTIYDRQKHNTANNNGAAAGSKQYARDGASRKLTPRHSEYDSSFQNHMTTCTTTTASAMTANRVAMNNGSANRHSRAGDTHRHDQQEHRSRWDGNTTPQMSGRSKYGRTSSGGGSFGDGNMGDYNCVKSGWQPGRRDENEDLRQMEDMDISPGSTPTEESMMEQRCASLGQTPSYLSHTPSHHKHPIITRLPSVSPHVPASASVTPTSTAMLHSVSQSNDKSASESLLMQKVNNQQITQQAIETLQKLQQALLAQQQQQQQRQLQQLLLQQIQQQQQQLQQNLNADSKSPESDGTPLQSPDIDHAPAGGMCMGHKLDDEWSRDSPHSEHSSKSARRDSPTQGHMGGSSMPISTMLSASHRKPDTVELTPSLANYYDSKLTGHVTGWPGDQVEKQADRLCDEAHKVASDQCMWVSSELKRARSLVRIAEIQSTLHEQRESSPQPGRKLRGGKVTGHRETGRKETGRKGTGGKTTGVKDRGVGETGGKEKGMGETGGKTTGVKERGVAETGGKEKGVGETGGKTTGVKERGVAETGGKEKGVGRREGKQPE
ncbi:hypothetical protein LSAT2_019758 [Lamellibrachia satsuma]|nr:hypothetical protein LSAT2_019758 [Lamellibrachia satsuma]